MIAISCSIVFLEGQEKLRDESNLTCRAQPCFDYRLLKKRTKRLVSVVPGKASSRQSRLGLAVSLLGLVQSSCSLSEFDVERVMRIPAGPLVIVDFSGSVRNVCFGILF